MEVENNMTYGKYKKTKEYLNAEDIYLCVNGEDPVNEMYYPYQLDNVPIIGIGYLQNNIIQIDLVVLNWKDRFDPEWYAEYK
jgi:hypothetical protein